MSTRLLDSAHRLYRVADLDALVKQLSRHNSTRANLRLVKPFDDAAFVAEVEARLKALDDRTARSTLGYIEIGRMLLDRKERGKQDGSIPHGEWVPWLKKKFPKAVQRLQEYMRVAKFLDTADTEAKNRVLVFCHQGFHAVLQQVQSEERLSKRKPKPAPLLDDVEGEKLRILVGDCMLRLKEIPDASIDCVITSPPYYRTLIYPGAITTFGGDPGCGGHDWDMRSKVITAYGHRSTASPENPYFVRREFLPDEEKTIQFGRCKKCGAESCSLGWEDSPQEFVAHLVQVFAEVKRVLKPTGVLWVNIADTFSDKELLAVPERLVIAMKDAGWLFRSHVIWHIPNRTPESAKDRPCRDHEHIFMFVQRPNYWFDANSLREPAISKDDPRRGKRVTYNGKYDGNSGFGQQSFAAIREDGSRNRRTVWSIPKQPFPGEHYAPMPEKLVEPLLLSSCPKGGVVLDPFAGIGTTGLVANRLNRNAVLIETSAKYAGMAKQRIEGRANEENAIIEEPTVEAAE